MYKTKKYYLINILFLLALNIKAQQTIPLIKANSKKVAIKDGNEGITRFWNHLEKVTQPIVYPLAKNQVARQVVFYTDMDSLHIKVEPNKTYPIHVLLHNKDTCAVLLTTITHKPVFTNPTESVPFTLEDGKRIMIKASINDHQPMNFQVDLGARYNFLLGKEIDKKNKVIIDGHIEDESLTGLATESMSSQNTLEMGKIALNNIPICVIKEGENDIGLVGLNAFEGTILELDFDKESLSLHKQLPNYANIYTKIPIRQTTGGLYIYLTLNTGKKMVGGWFFIDTGADNSLSFDSRFGLKNELYGIMKKIGEVTASSPGGDTSILKADLLEVPKVYVSNHDFEMVPTVLGKVSYAESAFEDGVIGIELLKRFNFIIDFAHNTMYLKPNKYYHTSFKKEKNNTVLILTMIFTLLLISYFIIKKTYQK